MKIEIEIDDAEAALIEEWLSYHRGSEETNSHGRLDILGLAQMLLEDVALAQSRPGSWEGANMITILQAHGYS